MFRRIVEQLARHPRTAGAVGFALSLLFAIGALTSLQELQALPARPEQATAARLPALVADNPRVWVEVPDPQWEGASRRTYPVGRYMRTEVIFANSAESVVVVATFSGDMTCDKLPTSSIVGVASPTTEKRRAHLETERYADEAVYIDLCTFCSRSNAGLGLTISVGMIIFGLLLGPMVLALNRHRRRDIA